MKRIEVMEEMKSWIINMIINTEMDIDQVWNAFNEMYVDQPEVIVALAWDEALAETLD